MNIKKILYGLGGALFGLLLDFFQNKQMELEIDERVNKVLDERGLIGCDYGQGPDHSSDSVIFTQTDSDTGECSEEKSL